MINQTQQTDDAPEHNPIGRSAVIIPSNQGSDQHFAKHNLRDLIKEMGLTDQVVTRRMPNKDYDGDGRYVFQLSKGRYSIEVAVPGLPLVAIRPSGGGEPELGKSYPDFRVGQQYYGWSRVKKLIPAVLAGAIAA